MPPYVRFQDGIRQKFWESRGRNPSCGLISLETGTKIFAWGNIVYTASTSILCALIFIMPLFLGHGGGGNHHEVMNAILKEKMKASQDPNSSTTPIPNNNNKWDPNKDEWIDKIYLKQSFMFIQGLLFVTFLIFTFWWFASWRLKKYIHEKDVPQLKKHFFIMALLVVLLFVPYLIEIEILWSRAFLLDVPIFIFEIMGLMFLHAFIVSLENPESSPQDDLNRIQYSQ